MERAAPAAAREVIIVVVDEHDLGDTDRPKDALRPSVKTAGGDRIFRSLASASRGSRGCVLFDLQEPELRVVFFGTFEVPGVSGEEHGGTRMVVRQARALLLAEALQLARIVRLH